MSIDDIKKAIRFDVIPSPDFRCLETHVATFQLHVTTQLSKNQPGVVLDDVKRRLTEHILRKLYEDAGNEFQDSLVTLVQHCQYGMRGVALSAYEKLFELSRRMPPDYLKGERGN